MILFLLPKTSFIIIIKEYLKNNLKQDLYALNTYRCSALNEIYLSRITSGKDKKNSNNLFYNREPKDGGKH